MQQHHRHRFIRSERLVAEPQRSKALRRPRRKVSSMLLSVLDSFLPLFYHTSPNPGLQRRGRLFVGVSSCFFVIALFFGIQMIITDHYPLASVLVMFSGCALVIINLLLLRVTRSTILSGVLLCLELLFIHWFQAYHDLGLRDPILLWMLVIPWLAALLIRPAYGFVFGGLVLLALSSFYLLEISGHAFPNYTGPEDYWLYYFLEISTLALFLGFLGWIYEGQTVTLQEANQDLHSKQADLRRGGRHADAVLEHLTDGFFRLNAHGCFSDVSTQAAQLLKEDREALIGHPAGKYFSDYVGRAVWSKLREAAQTSRPVGFELFYPPLGRWYDVLVYAHVEETAFYFTDITVRKACEQDVRAHLAGVIGFAELLEQEETGAYRDFARIIVRTGRQLVERLGEEAPPSGEKRRTVGVRHGPGTRDITGANHHAG